MNELFRRCASRAATLMASPWAFIIAAGVVLVWAASGPFFGFSQTWQLVINTGTTIVTFLMVFLIQNAQNRDAKALHLKLDELLSSIETARDSLIDLEDSSDEDLMKVQEEFKELGGKVSGAAPPMQRAAN